jgi:putative NADPH-quinone reductase
VGQLLFNPNLAFGYSKRIEMEPDLADAQKKITWANHLVWIHPLWWGGMPAILKGFIDRIFIPGFSHKYREDSIWWDKLLKNKSAHIICTADQPYWYYWLVYKKPGINELKKMTLQFAGINPVKTTFIGPIRKSSDKFRISWLEKVKKLGLKNL